MELVEFILVSGLVLLGTCFVFGKMGEQKWKAFIPFFREYVLFKNVWKTEYFWLYFLAKITLYISLSVLFLLSLWSGNELLILELGATIVFVGLVMFVIHILLTNKLSHAFGHGNVFTLGLVFFDYIFLMILGLEKNQFRKSIVV
ncbi:MAG: DUF5684 domain-containing protein [Bacillota bacterium]|nr:DUF5684 domain-containing protein [Bacillota bacterium]